MMNYDRVSVIIPTFNYACYIKDAVNSVLTQSYPSENIEIIVVDDGSTDNTKEILQPYIKSGVVQYYYQSNRGKANATYYAISKCSGKYIFNLDADDYFFPDKIKSSVEVFDSDSSIVHVSSPAKAFFSHNLSEHIEQLPKDIIGKPIDGKSLLRRFYQENILFGGGSTYAARASVLQSIVIPTEVDMYIDEFLILTLLPFGKSYFIDRPLSAWRGHTSNYSSRESDIGKVILKGERLLKSSKGVLSYIEYTNFDKGIVKAYQLKDATRRISYKESIGKKSVRDIINYIADLYKIKPNLAYLNKYNVWKSLLPITIMRLGKRIRNITKAGFNLNSGFLLNV